MAAYEGERKQLRRGKAPVFEAVLVKWTDNARSCNTPLSRPLVREKAEELAASQPAAQRKADLQNTVRYAYWVCIASRFGVTSVQ